MLAVSMSPPVAHFPVVQKRPKLSLQTSELPVSFSTSSRCLLTIATPTATTTPTTLNTFNNTYDLTHRPSPTSAIASPAITRPTIGYDRPSRSQSPLPKRVEAVYTVNLPYGIKPILKNTPYPRIRTNSISVSPRSTTRRVFFPAPKQVIFKSVIEEEISTTVYVARHSDLFLQDAEFEKQQSNDLEASIAEISSEQAEEGQTISISSIQTTISRPKGLERSSTSLDPDLKVTTPSGSRKRRRWEWTLGPLPKSCPKATSTSEPSVLEEGSKSIAAHDEVRQETYSAEQKDAKAITGTATKRSTPPLLKLAPPSPLLSCISHQKRGSSLDNSPRKRKAECLTNTEHESTDSVQSATIEGETSQTGPKRRERAATF